MFSIVSWCVRLVRLSAGVIWLGCNLHRLASLEKTQRALELGGSLSAGVCHDCFEFVVLDQRSKVRATAFCSL